MKLRILYAIMLIEICNIQGEYMKFTKMSLVAALLIGSSAFAIDNVKVSGDAKAYYSTDDAKTNGIAAVGTHTASDSLFNAGSSAAQFAVGLGLTADLAKGVSAGAHMTVLTTLGVQGQLVNNVWEGTNGATDTFIFDEAWVAATLGKTTVKLGRMELDTPLVFSEKWSIVANTFEAGVVINQDLPDTTLVGAYVGGSNGYSAVNTTFGNGNTAPAIGIANRVQTGSGNSTFSQFYNGAFAAAVVNNSFKPVVFQAWYYEAPQYLDAIWLQADLNMEGIMVGAQYTKVNYNKSDVLPIAADASNNAMAIMAGYALKDVATFKVAYSQTDTETKSSLGLQAGQNLATFHNGAKSKLYTEAWWNYAYVTQPDTKAISASAAGSLAGVDLYAQYTTTTRGDNAATVAVADVDMDEFTVTASKSVGPLDVTLAYIYTAADDLNDNTADGVVNGEDFNTIQAYLTLNF